jgi:peptidoglycan/xylan/chitin deacetylase (PgdA/CDA1 family)
LNIRNNAFTRNLLEAVYGLVCILTYFSGVYALVSLFKRKNPVILIYHSVRAKDSPHVYPDNIIDTQSFEKQMLYLSTKKNLVNLLDLSNYLNGAKNLPDNAVAVTFDDGYYDFYSNAYPILQRYNVPCTVFPIINLLNGGEIKWEDYLAMMISTTKNKSLTIKSINKVYDLSSQRSRLSCIRYLNDMLIGMERQKRTELLHEMEGQLRRPMNSTEPLYLSWKEVKELHGNLVSFGSHSYCHRDLTELSENDLEYEISTSKKELEKNLNESCVFFCYPHGKKRHFNIAIKDLLRRSGFRVAVTTIPGRISRGSDPLELRRIIALEGQMYKFKCAMIGLTPQSS